MFLDIAQATWEVYVYVGYVLGVCVLLLCIEASRDVSLAQLHSAQGSSHNGLWALELNQNSMNLLQ